LSPYMRILVEGGRNVGSQSKTARFDHVRLV
jgi:hypothetical protein